MNIETNNQDWNNQVYSNYQKYLDFSLENSRLTRYFRQFHYFKWSEYPFLNCIVFLIARLYPILYFLTVSIIFIFLTAVIFFIFLTVLVFDFDILDSIKILEILDNLEILDILKILVVLDILEILDDLEVP